MAEFFLLLLLFIIVYPVVRLALGVRRVHRQWRDAFSGQYDAREQQGATNARRQQQGRRQDSYGPSRAAAAESEYAEFEDIVDAAEVSRRQAAPAAPAAEPEPQIADAEWEDVRD